MQRLIRSLWFTLGIFILGTLPTLAQDTEELGRQVTRDDWLSFMPVLIGSVIIVIIVDAVFILPILRNNNSQNAEGTN